MILIRGVDWPLWKTFSSVLWDTLEDRHQDVPEWVPWLLSFSDRQIELAARSASSSACASASPRFSAALRLRPV